MLTIFSIPKKFKGQFGIIQRNAITSWRKISPESEIILFGDDEGTEGICTELKIKHIPHIERNEYNTPLINDVFRQLKIISNSDFLMFIMADIVLLSDPVETINKIKKTFRNFLIVGRRYEINLSTHINFKTKSWKEKLTKDFIIKSKLKGPSWMDYFIFTKDLFDNIPPFAIGRTFWDKWLVWNTLTNNYPVIDCTPSIIAAHQSHDYSHAIGNSKWVWEGKEAQENIKLAGGWPHGKNINHATYIFTSGKLIDNPKQRQSNYIKDNLVRILLHLMNFIIPFLLKVRRRINRV